LVWHPYFPFTDWRESQAAALDFIVKAFLSYDDVFVEAPTGIGKSAIAIALARWFASLDKKTYIATTTIELENQYIKDFSRLGLRQLHSKAKYPCEEFQSCDLGSAAIESFLGKPHKRCRAEACPYQVAKNAFTASRISISNIAYLLTCARFIKGWPARQLAIFDEAHALHETIANTYSIQITRYSVPHMPSEGGEIEWLREHYVHHLSVQICELEEELHATDEDDPKLERIVRKFEAAGRRLQNVLKLLADDPSEWVFDHQSDRLNILPLWGRRLAQELLPRIGHKRLYLSATLAGAELQARYLGIEPSRAAFLSLPSPFPVQNRLIYVMPLIKWNWRDTQPAIEQTCEILARVLRRHPDDRGLVHVSSYPQARSIVTRLRDRRLVAHENTQDKAVVMTRFRATPGAVLISPSSHEGLDLYDDLSRFQVIAKMPFASLGDKRVKRRMETDAGWYGLHTAQKLIQSAGRSIRSESDFATTYILDHAFESFFRRSGHLLPEYFQESLQTAEGAGL
jgi:ATP-dependent DNA helicase DinG